MNNIEQVQYLRDRGELDISDDQVEPFANLMYIISKWRISDSEAMHICGLDACCEAIGVDMDALGVPKGARLGRFKYMIDNNMTFSDNFMSRCV